MTVKCGKCNDRGLCYPYPDYLSPWTIYCDCPAGDGLRERELAERDNDGNRGIDRARERAEERLIKGEE